MSYLAIDIGGTWIKGAVTKDDVLKKGIDNLSIKKVKSPLHENASSKEFIKALKEFILGFQLSPIDINGIGVSTAGVVDYAGAKITKASPYLSLLKGIDWKNELEKSFQCKVSLINDADAATIGLSQLGSLKGNKTVGIMPIGTGLGFSIWKNGRRWRPGKLLPLLGSIETPKGDFNILSSASILAALDIDNDLTNVLLHDRYKTEREQYLQNLVKIIYSSVVLYGLDEVIVSGGLADAANACNYPLENELNRIFLQFPVAFTKPSKIFVSKEGNKLQLIGALALAKGESIAYKNKFVPPYKKIATETPYNKELQLQNMETEAILKVLWQAEKEAGEALKGSLSEIGKIADKIVSRITRGGRIIYVGAGTSGRIAAMDAVEIPCTYGFSEDRVLAIISGGISDAAIEIESDFEEDASAVPEMLLLNIKPEDTVIGISASGTAYYVQSALAFAKERGALSVMIQSSHPEIKFSFCDDIIALRSGYEVVAGSTRMKAGTATKKILNFMSSTIMIKMGKVAGPYMIDMACINKKLVERAQAILKNLYHIDEEEAIQRLESADMNLLKAIKTLNNK